LDSKKNTGKHAWLASPCSTRAGAQPGPNQPGFVQAVWRPGGAKLAKPSVDSDNYSRARQQAAAELEAAKRGVGRASEHAWPPSSRAPMHFFYALGAIIINLLPGEKKKTKKKKYLFHKKPINPKRC
jgi:hypothetical protein